MLARVRTMKYKLLGIGNQSIKFSSDYNAFRSLRSQVGFVSQW